MRVLERWDERGRFSGLEFFPEIEGGEVNKTNTYSSAYDLNTLRKIGRTVLLLMGGNGVVGLDPSRMDWNYDLGDELKMERTVRRHFRDSSGRLKPIAI